MKKENFIIPPFFRSSPPPLFQFRCSSPPPPGSVIRAIVVFSDPQHIQEAVIRCPTHAKGDAFPAAGHVLRADHPLSRYVDADPLFRRHAVIVPWMEPQLGMEETQYNFKFMCLRLVFGLFDCCLVGVFNFVFVVVVVVVVVVIVCGSG